MTIVFGTGNLANKLICYENMFEIECFIDNDIKKVGTQFWGYEIRKPEWVLGKEFDSIILTSKKYASEMRKQLQEMGVENSQIVNMWDLTYFREDMPENEDEQGFSNSLLNLQIRSQNDYSLFSVAKEAIELEGVLAKMVIQSRRKRIFYPGKCQVCRKEVNLLIDNQYSEGPDKVNFRERLVCPFCMLCNRQRVMARKVIDEIAADKVVYLTEQVTPMYQVLKQHFSQLIGSEYLDPGMRSGTITSGGIRHEDLMCLSFSDETIDCVVSNDVFEHVANIEMAVNELYRVLKSNGVLYATFPVNFNQQNTVKRAEVTSEDIKYILPPVYHGNPVSEDGSLVFYDYGMDIVSLFRRAGFVDAYFQPFYSVPYGNIGAGSLFIFIARK